MSQPKEGDAVGISTKGWSRSYLQSALRTMFYNIGSTTYKNAVFGVNKTHIAVGLHTSHPGFVPPVGFEVSIASTGYARVLVPADAASWGISEFFDGSSNYLMVYNKIPLTFGPCINTDWGTMDHFSLHAAFSDGTTTTMGQYLGYGRFSDPRPAIRTGYTFIIPSSGTIGDDFAGLLFQVKSE